MSILAIHVVHSSSICAHGCCGDSSAWSMRLQFNDAFYMNVALADRYQDPLALMVTKPVMQLLTGSF